MKYQNRHERRRAAAFNKLNNLGNPIGMGSHRMNKDGQVVTTGGAFGRGPAHWHDKTGKLAARLGA